MPRASHELCWVRGRGTALTQCLGRPLTQQNSALMPPWPSPARGEGAIISASIIFAARHADAHVAGVLVDQDAKRDRDQRHGGAFNDDEHGCPVISQSLISRG